MNHLKVIAKMRSISPILHLPSMSTFEIESPDTGTGRVESSPTEPDHRMLFLPNSCAPVLHGYTSADGVVRLVAPDFSALPDDHRFALAALGWGRESTSELSLDADEFDLRIRVVDVAFCLLNRLSRVGLTPNQSIAAAGEVLRLASEFGTARQKVFDASQRVGAQDQLWLKRLEQAQVSAKHLLGSARIPSLQGIAMHGEPRGSALALQFEGERDAYEIPGISMDWPCALPINPSSIPKPAGTGKFAVKPSKLSDTVTTALGLAVLDGRHCRITTDLPPKRYREVNDFLVSVGGVWNVGSKSHVFQVDAADVLQPILDAGAYFSPKDFEFFPTQQREVTRMLSRAGLVPGMRDCEPNAGDGALALAAAAVVGKDNVTCYELMPENVAKLQRLGFDLVGPTDFLSVRATPCFDCLLLNPPFTNGRDIAHITHALGFLQPGGVMVAIASTSWQGATTKPALAFKSMLAQHNAIVESIERGAFRDAGTDVATTMITLRKPVAAAVKSGQLNAIGYKTARKQPAIPVIAEEQFVLF